MRDQCKVCGRPLSNPISIKKGVGPECDHHDASRHEVALFEDNFKEDSTKVLEAMEKRTIELQQIPCPNCGYKCLKPVTWNKSTCIICKLNHRNHIFDL